MQATPFNPEKDIPPIPFDEQICYAAERLKMFGLPWEPHAGCFVRDPQGFIQAPSPFPNRIYFILNLNRFLDIFHTVEQMKNHLVWLPTWHQARMLCRNYGVTDELLLKDIANAHPMNPQIELLMLYERLVSAIEK